MTNFNLSTFNTNVRSTNILVELIHNITLPYPQRYLTFSTTLSGYQFMFCTRMCRSLMFHRIWDWDQRTAHSCAKYKLITHYPILFIKLSNLNHKIILPYPRHSPIFSNIILPSPRHYPILSTTLSHFIHNIILHYPQYDPTISIKLSHHINIALPCLHVTILYHYYPTLSTTVTSMLAISAILMLAVAGSGESKHWSYTVTVKTPLILGVT